MTTLTHGSYASYTKGQCRCELCTEANRNYQRGRNEKRRYRKAQDFGGGVIRSFRSPVPIPSEPDAFSLKGSGYARLTAIQDTYTGVQVTCKNCGASKRANPKLVGKARRIERCRYCK